MGAWASRKRAGGRAGGQRGRTCRQPGWHKRARWVGVTGNYKLAHEGRGAAGGGVGAPGAWSEHA